MKNKSTIKLGAAIYKTKYPASFGNGRWIYGERTASVRVMTVAEGYAMVRCKGAMPFVCSVKELTQ